MSWSVNAAGFPSKVAAAIEAQFANGSVCYEPEETARQSARTAITALLAAYPETVVVLVKANGSQNQEHYGQPGSKAIGSFFVRVEAIERYAE